jgi:hypothetical protein
MSSLQDRAVLMRFSAGLPGQSRKDKGVTDEVTASKGLGANSGKWIKELFEDGVLDPIKKKKNEARAYHNKVTFPFGGGGDDEESADAIAGISILPAALIMEYSESMRRFAGEMEKLVGDFLATPERHIEWAQKAHNGTFEPKNYPGCSRDASGTVTFDERVFCEKMAKKFYLRSEPLPVPNKEQFSAAVSGLLGTDADSVTDRVKDATVEAQKELLRRMADPVVHMAHKLAGQTCPCRSCKGKPSKTANFKDTLVSNVAEIAALVPKLNLGGDPELDRFASEMEALTRYSPDTLRDDEATRKEAADKARAMMDKLKGYKL